MIVIPKSMRGDILQEIHQGHQGLTKYRGVVWWTGVTSDVKELIIRLTLQHPQIESNWRTLDHYAVTQLILGEVHH